MSDLVHRRNKEPILPMQGDERPTPGPQRANLDALLDGRRFDVTEGEREELVRLARIGRAALPLLEQLLRWEESMGGWEAAVWREADGFVKVATGKAGAAFLTSDGYLLFWTGSLWVDNCDEPWHADL